jgi:hypothetical protein
LVWVAGSSPGGDIDLWDGARVRQLGQYTQRVESPRINAAGQAVWAGDDQIYLWDGAAVRLLSHDTSSNTGPRLNDAGQVVWLGGDQIHLLSGLAHPGDAAAVLFTDRVVGSAPVPRTVTIPAGMTTVTFPIKTQPTAAPTAITLSASYRGITLTAARTLLP